MSLTITPISPALGAQIDGVDLSQPLYAERYAAIGQASLQHQVLFFRNQPLTPAEHVRFAVDDYRPQRRVMRRATILGDRPF